MLPILLVGAGGHAQACIDVIEQEGRFRVAGIIGLPNEVGGKVLGYPISGTDADLPGLAADVKYALVTVGQIASPEPRTRLFQTLERLGFIMASIVSPRAYVSPHAVIGPGTIVMHGATVNAGAAIGRNCILNSHSLIEHGASIADHCHIATGAIVNGGVKIGEGTFVGSGARIRESVTVGRGCFIGMGQLVVADCPDKTRFTSKDFTD